MFKLIAGLLTTNHNQNTRHMMPTPVLHRQLRAIPKILSYLGHRYPPSNARIQTRYREVLTSPKLVITSPAAAGVVLLEMSHWPLYGVKTKSIGLIGYLFHLLDASIGSSIGSSSDCLVRIYPTQPSNALRYPGIYFIHLSS